MKLVTFDRQVKRVPPLKLPPRGIPAEGYLLFSTFHPGREFVVTRMVGGHILPDYTMQYSPLKHWALFDRESGIVIESATTKATTRKLCVEKSLVFLAAMPPEAIQKLIAECLTKRAKEILSM